MNFITGMATDSIDSFLGPAVVAMIAAFLIVFLIVVVALYVYSSFAWMTIAKKLNYKHPWLAWVPVANSAMILQLGGFHWAWIFLLFIPILGWIALFVLWIIATWRIFEKRKYPGALSLIIIASCIPWVGFLATIAYLIVVGFVAWQDKK
jgi:hypothetical protein